ncbi:hypothetical protein SFRURICE_019254, partial [Spodoptera frugiperda]
MALDEGDGRALGIGRGGVRAEWLTLPAVRATSPRVPAIRLSGVSPVPTRSPVRSQNSARHYGHLLQHGTGESPYSPRGRLQSYPHYQTDYAGE